ncbi:von Willebrand factor A domain-containing protein 2 [Alosa sapidissima]|uniref:von Willebrand factor A domain-containing protein 2 n=1 Tax=Alosa sapidissima TaxID=34773 RepID=UPI001C09C410|nr:von Willebrand factor A domain-containing protein 2 [Alosa sapidissima]
MMDCTSQLYLFLLFLLFQVRAIISVQEIQTDHETIMKINAAGEMMQCSARMDVLFLMDGSYSVGKGSFERCKHYAIKLSQALDIAADKVRVGVIQFGSTARLEIPLDAYTTKEELKKHLKKITYRGGSTQTGLALKYVLRKGFPSSGNSTVPRILILLSDGRSQGAVQLAATELKQTGVTLFAVGLRYPRWDELHELASTPTESHVFFAEHFHDAVNGLYTSLTMSDICTAIPSGCFMESYACERRTLEMVKELVGTFMCWKGSRASTAYTSMCPHYKWSKKYKRHATVCHRTICQDPCDSQPCQNGGTCVSEGLDKYRCVCPPGYGSDPHCAPVLNLDCSVDVLFLVEGSTELTLEGFLRFKAFLKRFFQTTMASGSPTKVGLAQYGDTVRMEARVGKHRDLAGLLTVVEAMKPVGGRPLTGAALQHVTMHGFQSKPVFADVYDDLPRVVVLLSATASADAVVEPAKYARDREVFLIAVGPDTLKAQMNNITANPQRTITYPTADKLPGKIPELRTKICSVDNQGCLGQAVDLVFVLDASDGVGRENFVHLTDFVRSTSVQFDINRDVAQVGLVVYGRQPVTVFELDAHDSGSAILRAVNSATFQGGAASTGSALLHVLSNSMTIGRGARPGVNKAVVVLTDGSGADDAAVPARKLRDNGVAVFAVGVGDAQADSLLKITGRVEHMVTAPLYEDLKYFEDVLVQMVCAEVKKPVELCRPNPCMNDGVCELRQRGFRCECRGGWEGPHCETRSRTRLANRGDQPKPAGMRRKEKKKSQKELKQRYKELRRRHAVKHH